MEKIHLSELIQALGLGFLRRRDLRLSRSGPLAPDANAAAWLHSLADRES
jgi:hypothetical protein